MSQMIVHDNGDVTKICSKCKRELPLSNFYKSKNSKDGYQNQCKECSAKASRKNRLLRLQRIKDNKYELAQTKFKLTQTTENALSAATPRELMQELVRRGYTGTLQKTEIHTIDLSKIFD